MKKVLKWVGIILVVIIAGLFIAQQVLSESMPEATPTPEADALAQKMLKAINAEAWDTTAIIQWTFPGPHDYLWDKERNFVKVSWENNEVLLHTKTVTGKAYVDGNEVTGDAAAPLIESAWSFFCNDSFWLNAPSKAFDPGTERSIVTLDDGREGLKVSYASGGVTPGDSYVWILDENGLPTSYKMWVKIIPIGGVELTWQDWIDLDTGAKIATMHKGSAFDLPITNVKGTKDLASFGLTEDPFAAIQ